MEPLEKLAEARKYDAQVKQLVAERRLRMASLAYLLLHMRDNDLHSSLGMATIAEYAVARGVTRSRSHARALIVVAQRVEKWPRLKAAFDRGELDWTKLADGLRALEHKGSPEEELRWLTLVQASSSRKVAEEAARARGEEPKVTQVFRHTPERQARLEHALQRAREKGAGTETEAEALARIVEEWLAGAGGSSPWDPTKLIVINRCADCGKTTTPGAEGQVAVSEASFEEGLCNAAVLDVRDGPEPVRRTIPRRIAQHVFGRSGGMCEVEGCGAPGFLHVHHEGGWQAIGHDPERMLMLCARHHAARHRGLLQIRFVGKELQVRLADGSPPISAQEVIASREVPPAQAG